MIQHHKHLSLDLLLPAGFSSSASPTKPALEARSNSSFSAGKQSGRSRPVARRPRSTDGLDGMEWGQPGGGQPPQHLLVDGQPALVRLTPTGIEWTTTQPGGGLAAASAVPFSEMLWARQAEPCTRTALCCLHARLGHRLEVFTFHRLPQKRCEWTPRKVVLEAADEEAVRDWVTVVGAGIEAASAGRPKSLLVLLNPHSGYRQGRSLYRHVVAPAFAGAGIKVTVWETRHVGHAQHMVAQLAPQQVAGIDGIVCVGGDGVFHEAMNGLLEARGAAAVAGNEELAEALGTLRLAHVPAGSTDAVACTLHGTRSAFAATAHVCLGDSTPLDVLRVDAAGGTKFASCIAAYGFLADVTLGAEGYRWLGPLRYDLVGAAKLLAGASYPARIRYLEGEVGRALSRHGNAHAVCAVDCATCRTASFMHSHHCSQKQMVAAGTAGSSSPQASPSGRGAKAAVATSSLSLSSTGARQPPSPAAAGGRLVAASLPAAATALELDGGAGVASAASAAGSRHFLQHAAGAGGRQGGEGEAWLEIDGEFCSIMLIVMPCRSDKTRSGMARHGHLADGRLKLVLVHKCSPLQYLRFLLTMSRSGCAPGQLPYVQVLDAVAVAVEPGGGNTSAWNLDGECVSKGDMRIAAECHHGLLRVFARGGE